MISIDNDKVFQLLTKMYGDINNRFDVLDKDMKEVKKNINTLYAKIDGDINNNLMALTDGYKVNYELALEIRDKTEGNTLSIDEITMSISELKDDINYIANKTIKNDSKINKITEQLKATRA